MITALILLYVALVSSIMLHVFGVFEKNNPKPQPNPELFKTIPEPIPEHLAKRGYLIEERWQIKSGPNTGIWVDWKITLNRKVYKDLKAANEALLSSGLYDPIRYQYRISPVYTATEDDIWEKAGNEWTKYRKDFNSENIDVWPQRYLDYVEERYKLIER